MLRGRPAWAHPLGRQSLCALIAASEVKHNCARVAEGGEAAWSMSCAPMGKNRTAGAPASCRKFPHAFWYGPGGQVRCRAADEAKETVKQRIREMTGRSGGGRLPEIVERLQTCMPGSKAYLQLAQTPKVFR